VDRNVLGALANRQSSTAGRSGRSLPRRLGRRTPRTTGRDQVAPRGAGRERGSTADQASGACERNGLDRRDLHQPLSTIPSHGLSCAGGQVDLRLESQLPLGLRIVEAAHDSEEIDSATV